MNRIIVVPGANGRVPPDAAAAAVERLRPAVVVGQLEIPQATTAAAFTAARRVGAITVLNPAPAADLAPELVAATDWLVPNETELEVLGAEGGARRLAIDATSVAILSDRLGAGIVVTLGARGAALARPGGGPVVPIPAPPAVAVDTTGAGDAFVGTFAAGLASGLDPGAAATLGCAAASASVTRPGTQGSYPSHDIARQLLGEQVASASSERRMR